MKSKTCSNCNVQKDINQFYKQSRSRDGCQSYCKKCITDLCQKNYKANPDKFKKTARIARQRRQQKYLNLFKDKVCVDCGLADSVVFELDHRENKVMNVSEMVNSRSWKAILDEFNKCDIVCANCHRRRTAKRGRWIKA
jgi:hypothetical protein